MKLLLPLMRFVVGLGYFAPLAMGILDSSFLVLPYGNDLLIVGLVARHHSGAPWYILSAASGSTLGVLLLAIVSRKLGESGVRRIAGENRYKKLKNRIGNRAGMAICAGAIAPPPFPFTIVIAAVAAVGYSLWRILIFTFVARATRFAILAILAIEFGKAIIGIAKSAPFEWAVIVFAALCAIASGFSIWRWFRRPPARQE